MSTTGAGGRGPLDDDELGRALSQGLSRALDGDVDPDALLRGARTGARRIERRRTVVRRGVVTLVAVAMLPLGATVVRDLGFSANDTSATSAGAAAPEAAAASSAASADGTQEDTVGGGPADAGKTASERAGANTVPSPTAPDGQQFSAVDGGLARDAGEVLVPDDALLRGGDLGLSPVARRDDVSGARAVRTDVAGLCGPGPAEALAQGGRSVTWTGAAGGATGWTVVTAVRVFAADGATDEVGLLRRAVGTCAASPGVAREPIAGLPGDDVLVAVLPATGGGDLPVVGVLRRGRVTVAVEVVVPAGAAPDADARRAEGVRRVRALLVRADARAASFATQAQADPSLG